MKGVSGIEWTDRAWSVVTGCTKASTGCRECWAKAEVDVRWSKNPRSIWFGREFGDVQLHASALTQPAQERTGRRIFVCPRSDLFHEAVPFEFIAAVFGAMAISPQHTFQVLTKRAGRMRTFFEWIEHEGRRGSPDASPWGLCTMKLMTSGADLSRCWPDKFEQAVAWPLPNVWLGVSAEDQSNLGERLPDLLACPAAVHWLSLEPLVAEVDLCLVQCRTWNFVDPQSPHGAERGICAPEVQIDALAGRVQSRAASDGIDVPRIDWVVVGGETGKRARPMCAQWIRRIRDQCRQAHVAFFMKQWGDWLPRDQALATDPDIYPTVTRLRVGKRAAGALLDGCEHREFPSVARYTVRESAGQRRAVHAEL